MTTDTTDTPAANDTTHVEVTFQDMYVLSAEDVDAFAMNWTEREDPPPFYVTVDGRRFAYTGMTFLVRGYGADLPKFVREEEAAGHLVLFIERDSRLLSYVFDPEAETDEGEEAAE